jgi:serine/threonine protein kinase
LIDSAHPNEADVASIADGTADPLDVDRWLSHLDECEACSRKHESLLDASAIDIRLRDAMSVADSYPNEEGFGQLNSWINDGLATQRDRQRSLQMQFPREIGHYELIRMIGCGGMGVVYEAKQRWLNRTVAIKLLRSDRGIDQNSLHQFTREFEAVGRLDHPGIVRAIDAGCSHGHAFLVMELVDGLDLERIRQCCGVLSEADVIEIAIGAAAGLVHAHENGVIHRDVKPSNLMLGRDVDGEGVSVRLMDLGLGQVESAITPESPAGIHAGTKGYQAPEQIYSATSETADGVSDVDSAVDQRADIFSLGATLLSLSTKLRSGQWTSASAMEANQLSTGLRKLIAAMLATTPRDRPESMVEVQRELRQLQNGTGTSNLAALLATASSKSEADFPEEEGFWSVLTQRAIAQTKPFPTRSKQFSIVSPFKQAFAWIAVLFPVLLAGLVWMLLPERESLDNAVKISGTENQFAIADSETSDSTSADATQSQPGLPPSHPDAIPLSQRVAHEVIRLGGKWETTGSLGVTCTYDSVDSFPEFPATIEWIMLVQTEANDQTLDLIVGLEHLSGLVLSYTDVTDEGIRKLASMTSLKKIYLYETAVTDESVAVLARLPNLNTLVISRTGITNQSVKLLENCKKLERFTIKATRADRGCCYSLGKLTSLKYLDIRELDLGDESLTPLLNLVQLREINLARTRVTAIGMEQLMKLPNLRQIETDHDQISEVEAKKLMQRYPGILVKRNLDE